MDTEGELVSKDNGIPSEDNRILSKAREQMGQEEPYWALGETVESQTDKPETTSAYMGEAGERADEELEKAQTIRKAAIQLRLQAQEYLEQAEAIRQEIEKMRHQARRSLAEAMGLREETQRMKEIARKQAEREAEEIKRRAADETALALSESKKAHELAAKVLEEAQKIKAEIQLLQESARKELQQAQAIRAEMEALREETFHVLQQSISPSEVSAAAASLPEEVELAQTQPNLEEESEPVSPGKLQQHLETSELKQDEIESQQEERSKDLDLAEPSETKPKGPKLSIDDLIQQIVDAADASEKTQAQGSGSKNTQEPPIMEILDSPAPQKPVEPRETWDKLAQELSYLGDTPNTQEQPQKAPEAARAEEKTRDPSNLEPPKYLRRPAARETPSEKPVPQGGELEAEIRWTRAPVSPEKPAQPPRPEDRLESPGQPTFVDARQGLAEPKAAPQPPISSPNAMPSATYSGRLSIVFTPMPYRSALERLWTVLEELVGIGKIVASQPLKDGSGIEFTMDLGKNELAIDKLLSKFPGGLVEKADKGELTVSLSSGW
ncbi:MAG: hypothetical protein HY666_05945 [Chloroflexi bacterium]|nr:hypothetical protein [Chloroflexota bacterium]